MKIKWRMKIKKIWFRTSDFFYRKIKTGLAIRFFRFYTWFWLYCKYSLYYPDLYLR